MKTLYICLFLLMLTSCSSAKKERLTIMQQVQQMAEKYSGAQKEIPPNDPDWARLAKACKEAYHRISNIRDKCDQLQDALDKGSLTMTDNRLTLCLKANSDVDKDLSAMLQAIKTFMNWANVGNVTPHMIETAEGDRKGWLTAAYNTTLLLNSAKGYREEIANHMVNFVSLNDPSVGYARQINRRFSSLIGKLPGAQRLGYLGHKNFTDILKHVESFKAIRALKESHHARIMHLVAKSEQTQPFLSKAIKEYHSTISTVADLEHVFNSTALTASLEHLNKVRQYVHQHEADVKELKLDAFSEYLLITFAHDKSAFRFKAYQIDKLLESTSTTVYSQGCVHLQLAKREIEVFETTLTQRQAELKQQAKDQDKVPSNSHNQSPADESPEDRQTDHEVDWFFKEDKPRIKKR